MLLVIGGEMTSLFVSDFFTKWCSLLNEIQKIIGLFECDLPMFCLTEVLKHFVTIRNNRVYKYILLLCQHNKFHTSVFKNRTSFIFKYHNQKKVQNKTEQK